MLRTLHEWTKCLFHRRTRQAMYGTTTLRHAYEHVVVMAVMEGVRPGRRPYYEGYVDALLILSASIARTL